MACCNMALLGAVGIKIMGMAVVTSFIRWDVSPLELFDLPL